MLIEKRRRWFASKESQPTIYLYIHVIFLQFKLMVNKFLSQQNQVIIFSETIFKI
jgi:hypothetical protein